MSYHVKTTLCHDITTYDILWQPIYLLYTTFTFIRLYELLGSTVVLSLPKILLEKHMSPSWRVHLRLTHCLISSPANGTVVGFHEFCYDGYEFVK